MAGRRLRLPADQPPLTHPGNPRPRSRTRPSAGTASSCKGGENGDGNAEVFNAQKRPVAAYAQLEQRGFSLRWPRSAGTGARSSPATKMGRSRPERRHRARDPRAGHQRGAEIEDVQFDSTGKYFVTALDNGSVTIWSAGGDQPWTGFLPVPTPTTASLSPGGGDVVVASGSGGSVAVLPTAAGQETTDHHGTARGSPTAPPSARTARASSPRSAPTEQAAWRSGTRSSRTPRSLRWSSSPSTASPAGVLRPSASSTWPASEAKGIPHRGWRIGVGGETVERHPPCGTPPARLTRPARLTLPTEARYRALPSRLTSRGTGPGLARERWNITSCGATITGFGGCHRKDSEGGPLLCVAFPDSRWPASPRPAWPAG